MIDPFKLSALSRHAVGLWHEFKGLLLFLFLMVIFRSAVADWSDVPTGSMKPTIIEGDRIFVNKMAYGYSRYSCPFADSSFTAAAGRTAAR